LISSGFGDIAVPAEITQQRQSTWQVTWEKESTITESNGVAEGLLQTHKARAGAQAELIQAVTHAVRTMGQTLDSAESAHPLSLHFMDVMAGVVEKSLRESSYDTIDQKEIDKLLDRLRKVLLPPSIKKSS
jgi:hypothetical protein